MFGHTNGVTVSLLVALCSFAVHTYGQNEPEVNTNLLRQILQKGVDLLSELDQLTNDKEDTETGDWLLDVLKRTAKVPYKSVFLDTERNLRRENVSLDIKQFQNTKKKPLLNLNNYSFGDLHKINDYFVILVGVESATYH